MEGDQISITDGVSADVPPNWPRRAAVLCVFGLVVAAILTLLQTQRSGLEQDYTAIVLVFIVWMLAAALIGSVYPIADKRLYGKVHDFKQDWSNAIRSVAILVGIHQASTKIPFSNVYELVGTLIFLALGLWWMSDRSKCGFFLALLFSLFGAIIGAGAKYLGYAAIQSEANLFGYVSDWCIGYSASITFGSIGRILSMPPSQRSKRYLTDSSDKVHVE